MFSFFKKKKETVIQAEMIDDRRESIEQSRQAQVPSEPDDRREAIKQSREVKKTVKKATPKKK
jgi:hypothetical protein